MKKIFTLFIIAFIVFFLNGCFITSKNVTIKFVTNFEELNFDSISGKSNKSIKDFPNIKMYEDNDGVWILDGWYNNEELFNEKKMPINDITLIAKWRLGDFAIYFDTNTDYEIEPLKEKIGANVLAPTDTPIKKGYLFKGWLYNNKPYIFNKMPSKSILLKANWSSLNESIYHNSSSIPKMFIELEDNLPLVYVDREDYVKSSITITNTDKEYELSAVSAEFKGRGNGSWLYSGPKKGYRLKFFNKVSLFGEAKSKHWVLLAGANFYDSSISKVKLAFGISESIMTNIEYTSSANWVELYVNGQYRGVYVLAEHIRVEENRVNLETDNGVLGYFIEYDAYAENEGEEGISFFRVEGFKYGFTVKSPEIEDYEDINISEQEFRKVISHVKNYTETTLKYALESPKNPQAYLNFTEYADIDSFIDMYILHELFKNTDTGWSSFFMYKKAGGKLYAGPAWDFDATAGKSGGDSSYEGIYVSDKVKDVHAHTASELYIALMKVSDFKSAVAKRFKEITENLKDLINNMLSDSFIDQNQESFGKNLYFWGINKSIENAHTELLNSYDVYSNLDNAIKGWKRSTINLRVWLLKRIDWLLNYWD